MICTATKTFEVEQYSTEGMWYRIVVRFNGKVVETFHKPTMREAIDAFERAGYKNLDVKRG